MKSEDGTGSRHALWFLKEMWDCHPTYFIQTFRLLSLNFKLGGNYCTMTI